MATDLERSRDRRTGREGGGGAPADRRRGHHLHLLPVRLGHGPDHGQGRPGAALGDDRRARASSSSTARPPTCSSTATASTSATGRRPPSWSASPSPRRSCRCPGIPSVARVFCTCFRGREEPEDRGAYLTSDCRGNLRCIQEEFRSRTGLHLRAGCEPEMMWLKLNDGRHAGGRGLTKPYCYHIDQFSRAPAGHPQGDRVRARRWAST